MNKNANEYVLEAERLNQLVEGANLEMQRAQEEWIEAKKIYDSYIKEAKLKKKVAVKLINTSDSVKRNEIIQKFEKQFEILVKEREESNKKLQKSRNQIMEVLADAKELMKIASNLLPQEKLVNPEPIFS